jgi:type I restriction enzyme R subunit
MARLKHRHGTAEWNSMTTPESPLKNKLIEKLRGLKYEFCSDVRDRTAHEKNFRQKFESLNCVQFKDPEFARLLDEIITPSVLTASNTLRTTNSLTREFHV